MLHGEAANESELWNILSVGVDSAGSSAQDVLSLLGTIDDQRARALIEQTLQGTNGLLITYAAKGLTRRECISYLSDLNNALLDPKVKPKVGVLTAVARAGDAEAAGILTGFADIAPEPDAGVAFGLVQAMGSIGVPFVEAELLSGKSAKKRETAGAILRAVKVRSSIMTFRAALRDPDEAVRTNGALGLALWGIPDGVKQLEKAASRADGYEDDALVALVALGNLAAETKLESLARSSDKSASGRAVWAIARSGSPRLKALAYEWKLETVSTFRAMLSERLLDPGDSKDVAILREDLQMRGQMASLVAAERLLKSEYRREAEQTISYSLNSSNEQIRQYAAHMAVEDSSLLPDLADKLGSSDPEIQIAALTAVKDLGRRESFEQVVSSFTSGIPAVSRAAGGVLLSLDPTRARKIFNYYLASNISYVRIYSAAMLLALDRVSGPSLEGLLPPEKREVR